MNAVELSKSSPTLQIHLLFLCRPDSIPFDIWTELSLSQKENTWNIEFFFWKKNCKWLLLDKWEWKCLIYTKFSVCVKRNLIAYRYIVQVTSWRCLFTLYSELTRWWENLVQPSTVPVCCISVECIVKIFVVEQEK